jgi:hypothetical protein
MVDLIRLIRVIRVNLYCLSRILNPGKQWEITLITLITLIIARPAAFAVRAPTWLWRPNALERRDRPGNFRPRFRPTLLY